MLNHVYGVNRVGCHDEDGWVLFLDGNWVSELHMKDEEALDNLLKEFTAKFQAALHAARKKQGE
jgi:hypothetical protein